MGGLGWGTFEIGKVSHAIERQGRVLTPKHIPPDGAPRLLGATQYRLVRCMLHVDYLQVHLCTIGPNLESIQTSTVG